MEAQRIQIAVQRLYIRLVGPSNLFEIFPVGVSTESLIG